MPSQDNFDEPPIYDAILNPHLPDHYADIWVNYLTTFYQTLISYLSQNGIFMPQLTTVEATQIANAVNIDFPEVGPVNGQLIYNIDVDAPQFWQSSSNSWRTIQFV